MILNRLCYASGNSEWGTSNPTKATAIKRIDNYGAGFLRAGARAVFAEGITNASFILYGLFRTTRTIGEIFRSSPRWTGDHAFKFSSSRTPGYTAWIGSVQAEPVLPLGHRQPGAQRQDVPRQLIPNHATTTTPAGPRTGGGRSMSGRRFRDERRPRSGIG